MDRPPPPSGHAALTPPPKVAAYSAAPEASRFFSAVLWTLFGTASRRVLSAVSTILVGRALGPERFGGLSVILTTVGVFSAYASLRLGTTATKFVSSLRHTSPNRAASILALTMWTALPLCAFGGTALAATSTLIASDALHAAHLATPLALGGLLVFLVYVDVQHNALAGFHAFKTIARLNATWGCLTLALVPVGAWLADTEGAITGMAIAGFVTLIATSRALAATKRQHDFPATVAVSDAFAELPVLLQIALPGMLISAVSVPAVWLTKVYLARHDGGLAEAGLFGAADQWRTVILLLPGIMVRVMLPILSDTRASANASDLARHLHLQMRSVMIVALPLSCALMAGASIAPATYGAAYGGSEAVLKLLVTSVFLTSLNQPLSTVFTAVAARWQNLVMHTGWAIALVLLACPLVDAWLARGLALAIAIADGGLLLVQATYIDRKLVPGALRRLRALCAYAAVLLTACYLTDAYVTGPLRLVTLSTITLAAALPCLTTLRSPEVRGVISATLARLRTRS